MSGGQLTQYRHDLCRLEDWARELRADDEYGNADLAELLTDLKDVLEAYDHSLSDGDIEHKERRAYMDFRAKWMKARASYLLCPKCHFYSVDPKSMVCAICKQRVWE